MTTVLNIINKDTDRNSVMASVDSLTEILQTIPFKSPERQPLIAAIVEAVNMIFQEKVRLISYGINKCQLLHQHHKILAPCNIQRKRACVLVLVVPKQCPRMFE